MLRGVSTILLALLLASGAAAAPRLKGYKNNAEAAAAAQELASLNTSQKKALFKSWKSEHKKRYADGSAVDTARFSTFAANLADVARWNAQPGVKYLKGVNEYSDLTFEEFQSTMLMQGVGLAELAARSAAAPQFTPACHANRKLAQVAPPDTWDWRTQGKVPAPRNQAGCGSCWAFASVGAMEIKAAIDGAMPAADLSEQQMVDCVNAATGYRSNGCKGGYSDEVFRYVSNQFAAGEAAYPYTSGSSGNATACAVPAAATATPGNLQLLPTPGFSVVANNAEAIMAAVSSTGPVITYFNVMGSFYYYSSGVYQASDCTTERTNHAMVIVGYNKTAGVGSPDSYWILRNSWGTWGDQGYVKVQMLADNLGTCRMYTANYLPAATSTPRVCAAGCGASQWCNNGACASCPANCASCSNAATCTACKAGWKGASCAQPDCATVGATCAANQWCTVSGGAPACSGCGANCMACSSSGACTACAAGWGGASCSTPTCGGACASKQFCGVLNGAPTCQNCPASCASCTSTAACTSCVYGYQGANCGMACGVRSASCRNGSQCCSGQCKGKRCT